MTAEEHRRQLEENQQHIDESAAAYEQSEAKTDERPFAIPVAEFEGEFVRTHEGKLSALTLEMPEGYKRGTHLILNLELRVRDVSYHEAGKDKALMRQHTMVLEEVQLVDAFDPDVRPNNVGGNSAGNAWIDLLADWLEGKTDELDFDGEVIPERLERLLETFAESTAPTTAADPEWGHSMGCGPHTPCTPECEETFKQQKVEEAEIEAARASVASAGAGF
jgi:hypothetical protein